MNGYTIAAQNVGAAFTQDGCMLLRFHTKKCSVEEKVKISEFVSSAGWLLFAANEIKDEDIPDENAPKDEWKTPSQRLRGVLYVLFKKENPNAGGDEFNAYYTKRLEKIIEQIKEKISKYEEF